jgi:MFS family permease
VTLLFVPGTFCIEPHLQQLTGTSQTWAPWRKHLTFVTACYFVFLSNYITVSISPILLIVATKFDASITEAGWLITVNLLFLGLGNLFWIPLSEKIGKRPVLIASTCLVRTLV